MKSLPSDDPTFTSSAKDRLVIRTITGFCIALFVLMVLSIHLSALHVPFASVLFGSKTVWRGQTAGFRVVAINPVGFRPIPIDRVKMRLRDPAVRMEHEFTLAGGTLAEFELSIPADLGPRPSLEITVETPLGVETFTTELKATDQPGPLTGKVVNARTNRREIAAYKKKGPYRVDLYPTHHSLIAGLANHIYGRITTKGEPSAVTIKSSTAGVNTTTDASGLFEFEMTPMVNPKDIPFQIGPEPRVKYDLPIVETLPQLLMHPTNTGFIRPSEELEHRIDTLPFNGPVHIDVWVGNALVSVHSALRSGSQLTHTTQLPNTLPQPVQVVAYRNIFSPDDNASWHIAWPQTGARANARQKALQWLQQLPGGDPIVRQAAMTPDGIHELRLFRLAMSRFAPDTPGAPRLNNTLGQRKESVDARRVVLRADINRLFAFTIILGLVMLTAGIIRHQRQTRRNLRTVIEQAIETGEDIALDQSSSLTGNAYIWDLILALSSLVLFGYSIWVLLTRLMQWGWEY